MPTTLVANQSLALTSLNNSADPNTLVSRIFDHLLALQSSNNNQLPSREELVAEFGNASAVGDALALLAERGIELSSGNIVAVASPITAPDRSVEAAEFHKIMTNPELREDYYRTKVVPLVESMIGIVRRKHPNIRYSDDEVRSDLLVAAHDILAEADPLIRDPLKHLRDLLPYRVIDIWRENTSISKLQIFRIKQIERASDEVYKEHGPSAAADEDRILARLSINQEQIRYARSAEKINKPRLLDQPRENSISASLSDMLVDKSELSEALLGDDELFKNIIKGFPPRTQLILTLYFRDQLTLRKIGEHFNICESRTCNIINSSLRKLRDELFPQRLAELGSSGWGRYVDSPKVAPRSEYRTIPQSAGFKALLQAVRKGQILEPSTAQVAPFIDGAGFFSDFLSRVGNKLLAFRSKILGSEGRLRFEEMSPQARQAFVDHVRTKHPNGRYLQRSRGIWRALGFQGASASGPMIKRELTKLGVYEYSQPKSAGFEKLLTDYKSDSSVPASSRSLDRYVDSPFFFEQFFSAESKAIIPFKVALYKSEGGIGFNNLGIQSQHYFREYIRSIWPNASDVKRDVRICMALGLAEHERIVPMMLARLYEIGVYNRPPPRSFGYERLLIDLRSNPGLKPCTASLLPYIDGPGFFHEFTSPHSRALKGFKSSWLRREGGLTFSKLTPEAFEHFRQFVRERCPDPDKIRRDGDAGMITLLGIRSGTRSLPIIIDRLEKLGVYPERKVKVVGFKQLIYDYHLGSSLTASWSTLAPYINGPAFFKSYFSYDSLPIKPLKNRIIQEDGPITEQKVGPKIWGIFREFVLNKYPALSDVPRDRALGRALGLSELPGRQQLVDKLVELGFYSR